MKEAAIAQGVVGAAGLKRNAAINIGVDLALRRPNSRRDEFDADQRGLKMLGEAGYAQGAMATFMERALNSKNTTPNILRTHPPTSDRVQRLRESMNPAMVRGYGTDNSAYKSKIRSLALVQ
jgi:predicted Zn-dependent protease